MATERPATNTQRIEHLEKHHLSGLAVWFIAVIVGIGAGVAVLALAARYTNQQSEEAVHAALVRQYKANLSSCERGNALREAVNDQTGVQIELLRAAANARLRAVEIATTPADRKLNADAAATYKTLIDHAQTIPIVDCKDVYTKP